VDHRKAVESEEKMARRNVTIQIDEDLIDRARVLAARKGTSISGLVARELGEIVEREARYEQAQHRALRELETASERGGRRWKREDLYER
jgi:hypothetical protein